MAFWWQRNWRDARSFGAAPSNEPDSASREVAYGLTLASGAGDAEDFGGGVGVDVFRILALIEANFGCNGLYRSFFD